MSLLQVWQFRQHLGNSSASDEALQRLLDAAEQAINNRIGPPGELIEVHRSAGPLLPLNRRAVQIDQVIENSGTVNALTLNADDYSLRPSGAIIERLVTGTNPRTFWRGSVEVTYQTADDLAERVRVQIGLAKLDMNYTPGIASESIEGFTESSSQQQGVTYAQLREEYLASLGAEPL